MPHKHIDLTPVGDLKDLVAWQVAIDFAVDVYAGSKSFPTEERFGLQTQLRRAAVSVASNIAEGHGRIDTRDYARHVRIARGSLKEAETQIIIAGRLGYIDSATAAVLLDGGERTSRLIMGLLKGLRSR